MRRRRKGEILQQSANGEGAWLPPRFSVSLRASRRRCVTLTCMARLKDEPCHNVVVTSATDDSVTQGTLMNHAVRRSAVPQPTSSASVSAIK